MVTGTVSVSPSTCDTKRLLVTFGSHVRRVLHAHQLTINHTMNY